MVGQAPSRDPTVSRFLPHFVSVQLSSVAQPPLTLCEPMDCSRQDCLAHHQHTELAQTHGRRVRPSNHLTLCRPLLLPLIFPSIKVFSNKSALCIRWPKYWSFSTRLASDYAGLISFRIDWFDLFAVQGILKIFLQHHSSKTTILHCSDFFMVQLSHLYMATEKP